MSDTPQGPGWWQASDGKWYPPEQSPGGGAAHVPTGASVGDAFNYGWTKFQHHVGSIIIAALIGFAILVVLAIIGFAAQAVLSSALSGDDSGGGVFVLLVSGAFFALIYLLGMFLFQMAIIRASLCIVYGQQIVPAALFSTQQLGPYLLASIVVSILAGIGYFLCIIPGIIVIFFTQWFGYFLLDKNMAPMDAIKASVSFVNKNLAVLIGFYIASIVAYIIGGLLCGIGLLVAVPVVIIAQAYMYRRLQGEPVAA